MLFREKERETDCHFHYFRSHDWNDNALTDSWPYTRTSTCTKPAVDKGISEEVGSQVLPDIDLSINILQCWSDLPTLLIGECTK